MLPVFEFLLSMMPAEMFRASLIQLGPTGVSLALSIDGQAIMVWRGRTRLLHVLGTARLEMI